MAKQPFVQQLDLREFGQTLRPLGRAGICSSPSAVVCDLLQGLHLVQAAKECTQLVATNRLFALAPTREENHAVRRVLSLEPTYRQHLLTLLLGSIRELAEDRALAETLEQLDHLASELLPIAQNPPVHTGGSPEFMEWDRAVWQSPDAITLLSKVVERPADVAEVLHTPVVSVGFDWLTWETPPEHPAPAPFADREPLQSPLLATRHPFWGALVATLDACTGDYPWQSLMLRGAIVRSRHRTLGNAEPQLAELWRAELGLYPAAPLIVDPLTPGPSPPRSEGSWVPGKPWRWLQPALDDMARAGAAILSEGTWRLTDAFRTRLMQDDEHMRAFEAVRRRSYRLAQAAERLLGSLLPVQITAR
jgi:hypothetical protein